MDKTLISAKITSKGQITIPKEIRELLGANNGDRIVFEIYNDKEKNIKITACTGIKI